MAGRGTRLRPHTLTTPKPLIPIAGKTIVQRLVEGIASVVDQKIEEIAFIIKEDFGKDVENQLVSIAESLGSKGVIAYQDEALGTAHAVYAAKESLDGNVIVAFADTLFRADFKLDSSKDGIIWVQKIEDPSSFGVVKLDSEGMITDFIEKPTEFVSDLAIIGIYYFRDGESLKNEIKFLLDNDIKEKGEYQLTNALENLKQKGQVFAPGRVEEWWDCGNKNATVNTNQRVLANSNGEMLVDASLEQMDSTIIEPCYIAKGVKIVNSTVGPYVSIGENTKVENTNIKNSIIQAESTIKNANLENSMVGNFVTYDGKANQLSLSDYSTQME